MTNFRRLSSGRPRSQHSLISSDEGGYKTMQGLRDYTASSVAVINNVQDVLLAQQEVRPAKRALMKSNASTMVSSSAGTSEGLRTSLPEITRENGASSVYSNCLVNTLRGGEVTKDICSTLKAAALKEYDIEPDILMFLNHVNYLSRSSEPAPATPLYVSPLQEVGKAMHQLVLPHPRADLPSLFDPVAAEKLQLFDRSASAESTALEVESTAASARPVDVPQSPQCPSSPQSPRRMIDTEVLLQYSHWWAEPPVEDVQSPWLSPRPARRENTSYEQEQYPSGNRMAGRQTRESSHSGLAYSLDSPLSRCAAAARATSPILLSAAQSREEDSASANSPVNVPILWQQPMNDALMPSTEQLLDAQCERGRREYRKAVESDQKPCSRRSDSSECTERSADKIPSPPPSSVSANPRRRASRPQPCDTLSVGSTDASSVRVEESASCGVEADTATVANVAFPGSRSLSPMPPAGGSVAAAPVHRRMQRPTHISPLDPALLDEKRAILWVPSQASSPSLRSDRSGAPSQVASPTRLRGHRNLLRTQHVAQICPMSGAGELQESLNSGSRGENARSSSPASQRTGSVGTKGQPLLFTPQSASKAAGLSTGNSSCGASSSNHQSTMLTFEEAAVPGSPQLPRTSAYTSSPLDSRNPLSSVRRSARGMDGERCGAPPPLSGFTAMSVVTLHSPPSVHSQYSQRNSSAREPGPASSVLSSAQDSRHGRVTALPAILRR